MIFKAVIYTTNISEYLFKFALANLYLSIRLTHLAVNKVLVILQNFELKLMVYNQYLYC